jgi:hypothetical protein
MSRGISWKVGRRVVFDGLAELTTLGRAKIVLRSQEVEARRECLVGALQNDVLLRGISSQLGDELAATE